MYFIFAWASNFQKKNQYLKCMYKELLNISIIYYIVKSKLMKEINVRSIFILKIIKKLLHCLLKDKFKMKKYIVIGLNITLI